jgi:cob(I)alamin adenosyltransferase
MLEKGLVQVYTGDGKGKTTAAFGLALRAAGQGHRVMVYQFLKPRGLDVGERFAIEIGAVRIRVESLDEPWPMTGPPPGAERAAEVAGAVSAAMQRLAETAERRFYDVLILDELVYCLARGLARIEQVRELLERRDPRVEIVLTGRGATGELLEMADLVTEMKNIKHPFDGGVAARRGIEY